jgi:1,2-diacylglycerol 3-beta-galactosyltransferase
VATPPAVSGPPTPSHATLVADDAPHPPVGFRPRPPDPPRDAATASTAAPAGATAAGTAPADGPTVDNPTPRSRPLLFLTSDTGGGHRSAARAVAEEVGRLTGDAVAVHLLDPFHDLAPAWVERTVDLYAPLIRHAPRLWGSLYHLTDHPVGAAALCRGGLIAPLRRVVDELRPAAVASFHPLLTGLARAARDGSRARPALATVVTDLVAVHRTWLVGDPDLLVVPSDDAARAARTAGMPEERIVTAGIPVGRGFRPRSAEERRQLRLARGLDPDAFTILLVGGADGSGGLRRRALALVDQLPSVQVVVVCGRHASLRRRLLRDARSRSTPRLRVLGYVEDMAEWMGCADVCATKAGPATIAEALACGLPLLLTSHLPGQETANIAWAVSRRAGIHVPSVADLVAAVAGLLDPAGPQRQGMAQAALAAARPEAATTAAHALLVLASPLGMAADLPVGPSSQHR